MELEERLCVIQYDPLPDLDALQDQLLEQLELLNQRIEAVLKEFAPQALPAAAPSTPTPKPTSTGSKTAA